MAKISTLELAKYAVDQMESGVDVSGIASHISAFLVDERRTRDAGEVLRAIDAELEKRGRNHVTITSAHEVSDEVKSQLAKLLGADKPMYTEIIDESVIGGVRAQSGEKQIDLTVKAKLARFKAEVMRSN